MFDNRCEVESPVNNRFGDQAENKEPLKAVLQGIGKLLNEAHSILADVEVDLIGPKANVEKETPPPYSLIDYSRQLMELALQVDFQATHIRDAICGGDRSVV